ncbi:MAG: alpha/beta fold hydrolase, partial [Dermatophilaceae bacterium]|nr:alpha/beta fold hydrolase [Dermatophilaceae bacterium]
WDLPGHGASAPYDHPLTVDDLADAVVEATEELRAASGAPIAYAGVSLGGAVGLALAVHHADAFAGVVSIASGAKIGEADGWHERADLVRRAGTPVMVEGSAKRWFAPGFIEREPARAAELLTSLQHADAASYARCCEALATFDVRDDLGGVEVPVLALAGELDEVAPPSLAELVADRSHGVCAVLAGAAHLPPVEQPKGTAHQLVQFLDTLREGGSA